MRATSKPFWITVNHTFPTKAVERILYKHTNNTIRFCHPISVAYTADQVQYKWLSGSKPVGMEDDLQMSQFELQKTFHREVNFTRSSESGKPIGISILRRSLWLQWAPSPCCKLCSYCSATPATFLFRSVLCRIRYDKKCDKIWYWVQFKVYPTENALCMLRCTCHAPSLWCSRGWGSGWTGRRPQTESR